MSLCRRVRTFVREVLRQAAGGLDVVKVRVVPDGIVEKGWTGWVRGESSWEEGYWIGSKPSWMTLVLIRFLFFFGRVMAMYLSCHELGRTIHQETFRVQ